jgi:hypothetical protein
MLDSSNELVDPSVASLSHPEKQINYIANAAFHTELAQKKKMGEGHTSISARGVSADTESIQIRSIAPDLHIRSATDTQ